MAEGLGMGRLRQEVAEFFHPVYEVAFCHKNVDGYFCTERLHQFFDSGSDTFSFFQNFIRRSGQQFIC